MPKRPEHTERLELRVNPKIIAGLEAMRRKRVVKGFPIPTRTDMIRELLEEGLRQEGCIGTDDKENK